MVSSSGSNRRGGYDPAIAGLICGAILMVLAGSLALIWQSGFVSGKVSATQSVAIPSAASAPQNQERKPPDIEGEAALVSANAATWQTVINAFGLVGLLFTVLYARAAWLEARASARADNRSLVLTRKALREQREGAIEQEKRLREQIVIAKQTLEATRATISENDRAWIAVKVKPSSDLVINEDNISIEVEILFENIGKSPAICVVYDYRLTESALNFDNELRRGVQWLSAGYAGMRFGQTMLPGESRIIKKNVNLSRAVFVKERENSTEIDGVKVYPHLTVIVGARYLLPGDDKVRVTYSYNAVWRLDSYGANFTGDPIRIPREKIELINDYLAAPVT